MHTASRNNGLSLMLCLALSVFLGYLGALSMKRSSHAESAVDLRAQISSQELNAFYSDPEADIWQKTFWDNKSLESIKDWSDVASSDFQRLTDDQKLLVIVGNADGEIGNGGVGQLFFNRANEVPSMQSAFDKMGCKFASHFFNTELGRLSKTDFMSKWVLASTKFSKESQAGNKEQAWEKFTEFLEEFYPESDDGSFDPISQQYWDKRPETVSCIKNYIKAHQDNYFIVRSR
jgi:hypothetical protein